MATRSPTLLLLRDEFIGYAKSKVMLVLWILMPVLSIVIYLALPGGIRIGLVTMSMVSATMFMSIVMSSLASTVASIMVAVDLVGERNRKVYDLFVIRPVPRDAIIWSKFIAVLSAVIVACIVAFACGIAIDAVRGRFPDLRDLAESLAQLVGVLAISTGAAVFIGVLARSILVAVILVLYVGQNLTILPFLPTYIGVRPDLFWLIMLASVALSFAIVWGAAVLFRRTEL